MPKVLYATGNNIPTGIVASIRTVNCTFVSWVNDSIYCTSTAGLNVGDAVKFSNVKEPIDFYGSTGGTSNFLESSTSNAQIGQPITFTKFDDRTVSCTGTLSSGRYVTTVAGGTALLTKKDPIKFNATVGGITKDKQYYVGWIPDTYNKFDISTSVNGSAISLTTKSQTFTGTYQPQRYGTITLKTYYIVQVVSPGQYRISETLGGSAIALSNVNTVPYSWARGTTIPFTYANIVLNQKYYIKEILDANRFTISETKFGPVFTIIYGSSGTATATVTAEFTTDPNQANSGGLLSIFEAVGTTPETKYAPIDSPYQNLDRIYFDSRFDYLNIVHSFSASISFPFEDVTQTCGKKGKNCALVPRTGVILTHLGYHGQNYIPAVLGYDLDTDRALCGDQIVQVNGTTTFRLFQLLVDQNSVWIKQRWYVKGVALQANSFNFKVFIFNKPVQ